MDKRDLVDKISKYIVGLMFVAMVPIAANMIVPHCRRQKEIRQTNAELQAKIERRKREIAALIDNQRRFRHDADFVEMIARQNHRVFPGELVFIFEKE